jgi:hypothetical protein
MARRTFIGNIYRKVKDPNLVSALFGHKEGSKAFQRNQDINEEMKRDKGKLLDYGDLLFGKKSATPIYWSCGRFIAF